jgi:hypothetical protein
MARGLRCCPSPPHESTHRVVVREPRRLHERVTDGRAYQAKPALRARESSVSAGEAAGASCGAVSCATPLWSGCMVGNDAGMIGWPNRHVPTRLIPMLRR